MHISEVNYPLFPAGEMETKSLGQGCLPAATGFPSKWFLGPALDAAASASSHPGQEGNAARL